MPLGIVLLMVWLVMLVRFPRIMLPASGIIVVLALLLAAVVGIKQWRHESRVDQLEISVRFAPADCDFGKPILVSIQNASGRTARQVSWQLQATQPGANANLLDLGVTGSTYQMDQPLHADARWQQCYAAPPLRSGYRAADLQYQAQRVRAEFQR